MGIREFFGRMFGRAEHAVVAPYNYVEDQFRRIRHPHHASSFWHGEFGAVAPPLPPGHPAAPMVPHPAAPFHPAMAAHPAAPFHPAFRPGVPARPGFRPGMPAAPFHPTYGFHPGVPAAPFRPAPPMGYHPAYGVPAVPMQEEWRRRHMNPYENPWDVPAPPAPPIIDDTSYVAPPAPPLSPDDTDDMTGAIDPTTGAALSVTGGGGGGGGGGGHHHAAASDPGILGSLGSMASSAASSVTGAASSLGSSALSALGLGPTPGPADNTATDAGQTVVPDTGSTDSNGQSVAPSDTSSDSSDMSGDLFYPGADVLGHAVENEIDLPGLAETGLDIATAMFGSTFAGAPHGHTDWDEGETTLDSFAAVSDSPHVPYPPSFGAASPDVEDLDWGAAFSNESDIGAPTSFGGHHKHGGSHHGEMNPNLYRETTIKL